MDVSALTFDVFGTVVDWRSSIIREGTRLGEAKGIEADWSAFADAWRGGYGPAMHRVRTGELPWTKIDDLHRMILDTLIDDYGLAGLSENELADLNCVWHRLDPWPDSVGGLTRLKHGFTIATLSNGNVSLLSNMAKRAGLPWDVFLCGNRETLQAGSGSVLVLRRTAESAARTGDDGCRPQGRSSGGSARGAEDCVCRTPSREGAEQRGRRDSRSVDGCLRIGFSRPCRSVGMLALTKTSPLRLKDAQKTKGMRRE